MASRLEKQVAFLSAVALYNQEVKADERAEVVCMAEFVQTYLGEFAPTNAIGNAKLSGTWGRKLLDGILTDAKELGTEVPLGAFPADIPDTRSLSVEERIAQAAKRKAERAKERRKGLVNVLAKFAERMQANEHPITSEGNVPQV